MSSVHSPLRILAISRGRTLAERLAQPIGTLLVNLVGSFALGLLAGAGGDSQTVIGIAGLGAFTTFSTGSFDIVLLPSI